MIHRNSEYPAPRWQDLTEIQLRYDCFLGDIRFIVGGTDFSVGWGGIPIFDLALSLRTIAESLDREVSAVFEFTESDDVIEFDVRDEQVAIRTSYASGVGFVRLCEFRTATADLLGRVRKSIESDLPALRENREYRASLGDFW